MSRAAPTAQPGQGRALARSSRTEVVNAGVTPPGLVVHRIQDRMLFVNFHGTVTAAVDACSRPPTEQ